MKYISIKEFTQLGFVQELNRQFLHPLGMALEVEESDDDDWSFSAIWDGREDLGGIIFGFVDKDDLEDARRKQKYVLDEWYIRETTRRVALGYMIQPILEDFT